MNQAPVACYQAVLRMCWELWFSRVKGMVLPALSALFLLPAISLAQDRTTNEASRPEGVVAYGYDVVAAYPHNPAFFTQGLLWHNGTLYEGTGRYGESALMKIDLESGEATQREPLSRRYFGEGIAVAGDRLFQLTWRENTIFEYDAHSLERVNSHYLATEGWGVTWDGQHLIVSDGSDRLYFLNPETLTPDRVQSVRINGQALRNLNELEFINDQIWANVWMSEQIVSIDPGTGEVTAVIDLRGLREQAGISQRDGVLNGIAWDKDGQRLFVTGKLWPKLFEIRIPGMDALGQ